MTTTIAVWILIVFNGHGVAKIATFETKLACEQTRASGEASAGKWLCLPATVIREKP
jgi:hypothetical protein